MILWRCQHGEVTQGCSFNFGNGACGEGIYAMKQNDKPMQKYYSKQGESTFEFEVDDKLVKEVKGLGLATYWSLRERIYHLHAQGFRVFICKHVGINIPKSKQVLITDCSVIKNVKKLDL
jgi:hypothetical protein